MWASVMQHVMLQSRRILWNPANFSNGKYCPLARNFAALTWIILSSPFRGAALLINHEQTNWLFNIYVYFRGGRSREARTGEPSRDYDAGVYARRNHIGYHPTTLQIKFSITKLSCRSSVYLIAVRVISSRESTRHVTYDRDPELNSAVISSDSIPDARSKMLGSNRS